MWNQLPAYGQETGDEYLLLDNRRVRRYHELCRQVGVDPDLSTLPDVWTQDQLDVLLARNVPLISAARDDLLSIHRLLARRTHAFILTDSEPRILDLVAATEVSHACAQIGREHRAQPVQRIGFAPSRGNHDRDLGAAGFAQHRFEQGQPPERHTGGVAANRVQHAVKIEKYDGLHPIGRLCFW